MKHILQIAAIALLTTALISCNKEDENNTNTTPQDTTQPKTYTYIYNEDGIPMDTVMAHTDVDTFYVIPTRFDLFATVSENNAHNIKNHLENCHNANSKTFGKGDLLLRNVTSEDSTYLSWFGYNVLR